MPTSELAAPRPTYVLRGHAAAIHALCFSADNSRLLTGDADGWLTCWGLALKRPIGSWRAHQSSILGLSWWESSRELIREPREADTHRAVISHGRDGKLVIWRLGVADESSLDAALPVDLQAAEKEGTKPEILIQLELNTMNFCSFAWCLETITKPIPGDVDSDKALRPILLAVPNTLDSEAIDIFHLPSTRRLGTVPAPKTTPQAGMVMTLSVESTGPAVMLAAGYESGHAVVYVHANRRGFSGDGSAPGVFREADWNRLYLSHSHTQPILSLATDPKGSYFLTSSADPVIAKHSLAGLLDKLLDVEETFGNAEEEPLQTTKTKHAGQQSICIREDGKIFATAGWDSRIRVYSTKTMKEVAVLKWHREGCYSTAFARIQTSGIETAEEISGSSDSPSQSEDSKQLPHIADGTEDRGHVFATPLVPAIAGPRTHALESVAEKRERKAKHTHWLAAGSKDGKVSLWDIF